MTEEDVVKLRLSVLEDQVSLLRYDVARLEKGFFSKVIEVMKIARKNRLLPWQ